MLEVFCPAEGRFAIREIGASSLDDVLAVFSTQREADEWMLNQTLTDDLETNGLGTLRPGEGQSIS